MYRICMYACIYVCTVCINNHFHRRPLHGAAERLLDFKRLLFQKNIVDDFDESWVRVKLCIILVHMVYIFFPPNIVSISMLFIFMHIASTWYCILYLQCMYVGMYVCMKKYELWFWILFAGLSGFRPDFRCRLCAGDMWLVRGHQQQRPDLT